MLRFAASIGLIFALGVSPGCDCSADTGGDATPGMDGGTTPGVDSGNVGIDSPFVVDPGTGQVLCSGVPCACDNGIDDDGDGLIDGEDPECTGPYDDDEGTFATGIPGDNVDFCQDCFFDGNSGQGDDGCQYHTDCLYGMTPMGGGMSGCFDCDVTAQCVDFCRARTPNGCDCFGCCEVQQGTGTVDVLLLPTCSLDNLDDTDACPRCEQTTDCYNECGRCELCAGRTVDDLPADCYMDVPDGGVPYTCDDGEQTCDPDTPCPDGFYCQQGCCLVFLI